MFLSVVGSDGDGAPSLALEEPDDCTRFHVARGAASAEDVRAAVAGAGAGVLDDDGEHAWIEPAAVEGLALGRVGDGWADRFAGMVAYATSKGWVDDEGRIRAHIE
jgi:hypothetical protein